MPTATETATECTCERSPPGTTAGRTRPERWCPACQADCTTWLLGSEAESAIESDTYELSTLDIALLDILIVRELKGTIA